MDRKTEQLEELISSRRSKWPRLTVRKDGTLGIKVSARHLTSTRARIADYSAIASTFCVSVYLFVSAFADLATEPFNQITLEKWLALLWPFLAVIILLPVFMQVFRWMMSATTKLDFTMDTVAFRSGGRVVTVPLSENPEITVWDHDRQLINDKECLSEASGYYSRSFFVVWHDMGERLDVAEIFGRRQAESLRECLRWLSESLWRLKGRN